jgi:hypothetical protein
MSMTGIDRRQMARIARYRLRFFERRRAKVTATDRTAIGTTSTTTTRAEAPTTADGSTLPSPLALRRARQPAPRSLTVFPTATRRFASLDDKSPAAVE